MGGPRQMKIIRSFASFGLKHPWVSLPNMVKLLIATNLPGGLVVFGLPSISGANQKKN